MSVTSATSIPMTPTAATASSSVAATGTGTKTLDVNDFLKLLSVQMNSQDPLNPTQDTQFISQMASFTSLQQMNTLNSSMANFMTQQTSLSAQNYIGKNVTLLDPNAGGSISGIVSGIKITDGSPMLVVNGKSYSPANLLSVQQPGTGVDPNTLTVDPALLAGSAAGTTPAAPATATP